MHYISSPWLKCSRLHFSFGFLPFSSFYPQASGASTPSAPTNSTQPSVTSSSLTPTQPPVTPTSNSESPPTHPDSSESSDKGSPPSQPPLTSAEASATSSTDPETGESGLSPVHQPWPPRLCYPTAQLSCSFCFLMSHFHTCFHCLVWRSHQQRATVMFAPFLMTQSCRLWIWELFSLAVERRCKLFRIIWCVE